MGVEEVGESNWGGVGGHGLFVSTSDSFPPSKKLEESLDGEPGCGSSGGGRGAVKLLGADCLFVPVLSGRVGGNMAVECRTREGGKLLGGWGSLAVEGAGVGR